MSDSLKPRAFEAIIYGGLIVGILDGIFALVFYGLILGGNPLRIFQTISAGLLGKETAYAGGIPTFLLGILLHFIVATLISAVYYAASLKLRFLLEKAVLCGLLYGMAAYLAMNYVIIPLSRIGSGAIPPMIFVVSIIGHALLVGLPIALITRWSAQKQ